MPIGIQINTVVRNCLCCGKEFTSLRKSHVYCSSGCRHTAQGKRRLAGEQRKNYVCPVCGSRFVPHNNYQTYCSTECKRKHINAVRSAKHDHSARKCPICGNEFIPHNGFQRYCCSNCSNEAARRNRNENRKRPEVRAKRLAYQKEYYSRPDVKARSDEYNRNWSNTHKKRTSEIKKKYKLSEKGKASESRYMEGAAYKAARHRKDVKRRFRKNNNGSLKIDSGIHWTALVDRVGSIKCTICGRICNPDSNDKGLHPTVDHIIPLYSGGTHTWDNVCLLCMRCNSLKGHKRTLDDVKSILSSQQGAM